jgi:hypothetical protein
VPTPPPPASPPRRFCRICTGNAGSPWG